MTLEQFFAIIGFLFTFVCVVFGMAKLVDGMVALSRWIFPSNGG